MCMYTIFLTSLTHVHQSTKTQEIFHIFSSLSVSLLQHGSDCGGHHRGEEHTAQADPRGCAVAAAEAAIQEGVDRVELELAVGGGGV